MILKLVWRSYSRENLPVQCKSCHSLLPSSHCALVTKFYRLGNNNPSCNLESDQEIGNLLVLDP